MPDIPDIFGGKQSMLGPSLRIKKKMRVQPSPPGSTADASMVIDLQQQQQYVFRDNIYLAIII